LVPSAPEYRFNPHSPDQAAI
jgi:hypothetical protein